MNTKKLRPAAPGRAHRPRNSKELEGAFDPEISEEGREPQDSAVPIAHARIVVGRRASFLYIGCCPLCRLEHTHGLFVHGQGSDPLAAFAWHGGYRVAACFSQGPGRIARRSRTVVIHPDEWHEPEGELYQLVHGPEPACFTPLGIKSKDARLAMAALARSGAATSVEILRPRSSFVLWRGDK
jgi:hypothetical protein